MSIWRDLIEYILLIGLLFSATKPLGLYFDYIFSRSFAAPLINPDHGSDRWFFRLSPGRYLTAVLRPIENFIYRIAGVDPREEQTWTAYSFHLLTFSAVSFLFTYAILRLQHHLPLNPTQAGVIVPHLAYNTTMSFGTNTDWQSYSGETDLSYFSQMIGLTVQNFFSPAVGLAAAVALIRGLSAQQKTTLGNFWVDLVRSILYVLLPISIVLALFYISQGMIQNFLPPQEVLTLEGTKQIIAQGPVASQVAIKILGTNGGGFFNANAAHPYENPTPLSNFIQIFSMLLIPSATLYLLGRKMNHLRHAWAVWTTVAALLSVGTALSTHFEYQGNPVLYHLGASNTANLEGKENRFGIFGSTLFGTVTTATSCGAVNSAHDSFTPLGGLVPLVNMLLGEIIFGGVGAGLYGIVMYILLTVFIAGLMVGRTPEYGGKKIEGREIKYVMLALVVMALSILSFGAYAVLDERGLAALGNSAQHGFTEIIYAYGSAVGNNGSAFAGLSANTPFWNLTLAFAIFLGRFFMMIPMLGIAGSMARKKVHPVSEGSFPTDGILFVFLLIGVIFLVGALTFFPALVLGPIAEHYLMLKGIFI